jgi:hypothetical protein
MSNYKNTELFTLFFQFNMRKDSEVLVPVVRSVGIQACVLLFVPTLTGTAKGQDFKWTSAAGLCNLIQLPFYFAGVEKEDKI